ncbi:hypothetical protein NL676_007262 [Syzygium grande]|nr:hypothetical protein NL676_007262 [Syzygium grande]
MAAFINSIGGRRHGAEYEKNGGRHAEDAGPAPSHCPHAAQAKRGVSPRRPCWPAASAPEPPVSPPITHVDAGQQAPDPVHPDPNPTRCFDRPRSDPTRISTTKPVDPTVKPVGPVRGPLTVGRAVRPV